MRKKYYIFVLTFLCMLCGQMGYGQDDYKGDVDHYETLTWNGVEYNINVTVYENGDDFLKAHPELDLELAYDGTYKFDNEVYESHLACGGVECSNSHNMEEVIELIKNENNNNNNYNRLHEVEIYYWDINEYVDYGDCTDSRSYAYPCYNDYNDYIDYGDCSDYRSYAYPCDTNNPCDSSSSAFDSSLCEQLNSEDDGNSQTNYSGQETDEACTQPCTTTQKSTTSKTAITYKAGVAMCPCEETLFESDFADIVDIDDLLPPDFKIEGTTVKIKSENGEYKKPSQLNPNSHFDRIALQKYAVSLTRDLNTNNHFFYIATQKGTKLSAKNAAFTNHPVKFANGTRGSIVSLNSNGGYSKDLDNVNNFKSILKHEIFHVDDNKKINFESNLSTHVDVYINAMKHITFGQTNRDDFQIGIINSLKNYILNMDKRTDTKTIYYPNHIKQKISDFNNIAGLDFTFHINTDYNKKGTLNIVIRDRLNGNKPLPEVLYTKISDEN